MARKCWYWPSWPGLVVVRVRREDAGEALDAAELLRAVHGLARGVVRGAREDRHAAVRGLDGDLDDAQPFGFGQGRRLAGRAAGNQQRDAAGDLPVNVSTKGRLIE